MCPIFSVFDLKNGKYGIQFDGNPTLKIRIGPENSGGQNEFFMI